MKMKFIGVLLSSICACNLAYADTLLSKPAERWVDFQSADARFQVQEDTAGVVFYRRADDLNGPSANIYIDGEYLASLLPNGFRYTVACPKNQRFESVFTGVAYDNGYARKAESGVSADLPAGSISYFKVVANASGLPQIVRVPADEAKADLSKLRQQTHTLPRVSAPKDCGAQPVVQQKYTLDASALFAFNRADPAHILPKGKREVQKIAAEIKQSTINVSSIEVVGHTDPEGSSAYNQQLSETRAQTVKSILAESGLNAAQIQANGMGERKLLVSNCRQQYPNNPSARQQCDQPNRRVEILIRDASAQSGR